ncbi:MAG: peptide chain release factor 2 [Clostridia bacterium]|nr:peptide chain release factor 2 [Clostridia bacterium]
MLDIGLLKSQMVVIDKKIKDLGKSINCEKIKNEISELEAKTTHADFWNDTKNSQTVLQSIKSLKEQVRKYEKLTGLLDDFYVYLDMYEENPEDDTEKEISKTFSNLQSDYNDMHLLTLLSGEHDQGNAIITLHAGAGGTEAQDWVEMLLRMYSRWAENKGFKYIVTDILPGDEAGIKSVTANIIGDYAFGYLQSEIGVHRLVRISPFDSSGRRHTSFASVEVIPEISDAIDVEIKADDLRIDTYRSSGAGGQHVNKTDSAIRITHIPTGIVCACQSERSQHQNKEYAMKLLISKLFELKEREHKEKIEDLKGIQKEIGWGSQIRSYVMCPYTMVKDHRTNFEMGDVNRVLDGDIDQFINEFLLTKGK